METAAFRLYEGEIRNAQRGRIITLVYPDAEERVPIKGRLEENLEWGKSVYLSLLDGKNTQLAKNGKNPIHIRPPWAGSVYQFSDGHLVINRRDKFAPTNKLYHSTYAGSPETLDEVISSEGIVMSALRGASEECLLITKEKGRGGKPYLILPSDSSDLVLLRAKVLGLDLPTRKVKADLVEGEDLLEVYRPNGQKLFTHQAFFDITFNSEICLNAQHRRKIELSSEEVLPIDAEGMEKKGRFAHFNRESYLINPMDFNDVGFGNQMPSPINVYKTAIKEGVPIVFTPAYQTSAGRFEEGEYIPSYDGPDMASVAHPHTWAPDNQIARHFDALGVKGYDWVRFELAKIEKKLKPQSV